MLGTDIQIRNTEIKQLHTYNVNEKLNRNGDGISILRSMKEKSSQASSAIQTIWNERSGQTYTKIGTTAFIINITVDGTGPRDLNHVDDDFT